MSLPPERELIRLLTQHADVEENRAGYESDNAIVELEGIDLVVTVDQFAADTHAPPGTPPAKLARLAVEATVSDLAAAGADPLGVLAAYGLPASLSEDEVERLGATVAKRVEAHGGEVLGGDTKPRDQLTLTLTGLGTTPAGTALTRESARPGDKVLVTGPLGGAGAALDRIQDGLDPESAAPLLEVTARVDAGRALVEEGAECAMDVSDGLADVAVAVSQASGVRVALDAASVPLHPWALEAGRERGLSWALSFGGDYELVACVHPERVEPVMAAWRGLGLEPAIVGGVEEGEGAVLEREGSRERLSRGYEHGF